MRRLPSANVEPPTTRGVRRPAALRRMSARAVFVSLFLLGLCQTARAAKWHECPEPPFPTYPSDVGATNSPFIQPDRDLTIVLNSDEVAATGGFAAEPGANAVSVAFHSSLDTTVSLAPISATALAPDALTFAFPDSQAQGLGSLAGPVEVTVQSGGRVVAHISWEDLVALPPSNDLTDLVNGGSNEEVMWGAVGADGNIWFPAHFQGDPMAMPTCPGDFIVPVNLEIGGAILALDGTRQPLSHLRTFDAYFGEVHVEEYDLYGKLFMANMKLAHVAGTRGVSLCKLNDAVDMVLRLHGAQAWATSQNSPFAPATTQCGAVPLVLQAPRNLPGNPPPGIFDSFDNVCPNRPSAPSPQAGGNTDNNGKGPANP